MSLLMLHLSLSLRALYAAGRAHGLVRDARSVEPGYLVHAAFERLFGKAAAPKPFDIGEPGGGDGDRVPVLAYAACGHEALAARAAAAGGDLPDPFLWKSAGTRPVPGFAAGQRLGFRLRACPVVRVGRGHPRFEPGAEVDPYVALVQRRLADAMLAAPGAEEAALKPGIVAAAPPREQVYAEWLAARFGAAAEVEAAPRLTGLRDARLWRRGVPGEGAARSMHGHGRPTFAGRALLGRREAVFEGTLRVADPGAFAALLARGVGRHRAFGFGMLLLRPPGD